MLSSCQKTLEIQIDDIVQAGPFNGVIMVYQANIPLYVKAHGIKDLESKKPLDLDDQFMIGSITKQITAVTALSNNVSAHDLLTHTSGGEFLYSSQGYLEIAKICEQKTGVNFDVSLKKTLNSANIFNINFQDQNTRVSFENLIKTFPKLVTGHEGSLKNPHLKDRIIDQNSSGGLISNARDLMRWNEALYEKKIWGEIITKILTHSHIDFTHRWGKMFYGYGVQIFNDGYKEYSHGGIINGFHSTLLYYPHSKIHVVILENILRKNEDGSPNFKIHDDIRMAVKNFQGNKIKTSLP